MNFVIWIKEKKEGFGAAWECPSLDDCYKLFNQIIGLYTYAYENNIAYVENKNGEIVVSKKQFKNHFKKWFDKNVEVNF
nr:hypothetical protein [Mycobacterium sp. E3298]